MRLLAAILGLLVLGGCQEPKVFPKTDKLTAGIFIGPGSVNEPSEYESGRSALPRKNLTASGLDLLKRWEGEMRCPNDQKLHCPYNDVADYCTIGHGHLIAYQSCEEISEKLTELGYLDGVSDEEAERLLKTDLIRAQLFVETHMSQNKIGQTELTDHQYDALVSFTYNVGGRNFARSTLLKRIKSRKETSGDIEVVTQFNRWIRAGGKEVRGLVNRRKSEVEHFFKEFGVPDSENYESGVSLQSEMQIDIRDGEIEIDR